MIRMFSVHSRKTTPIAFWMIDEKYIFGIKHYASHDGKLYRADSVVHSEKAAYAEIRKRKKLKAAKDLRNQEKNKLGRFSTRSSSSNKERSEYESM